MEAPPPPPAAASSSSPPPRESLAQRYKVVWRLLLISNLALGAYMFASARKKNKASVDTKIEARKIEAKVPPDPVVIASDPVVTSTPSIEEFMVSPPLTEPVKEPQSVSEDQQRKLFEWILEEKRKVKPKDREEKKLIDEEKAILKKFIRSTRIPSI